MKRMLIVPIVGIIILLGGAYAVRYAVEHWNDPVEESGLIEGLTFTIEDLQAEGALELVTLRRIGDALNTYPTIRVWVRTPLNLDVSMRGLCLESKKTDKGTRLVQVDCPHSP